MKPFIRSYRYEIILFLGLVVALFYELGYMPLSADEPIRALIAADMAYNGHYIAPELNGSVYLNKPPLYNWVLLGFFKIFNSFSEWVVRLPSILSLLLWAIIIVRVVRRELGDTRLGMISAMALITSGNLLFYSSYLGHIDVTYSLITFIQLYVLIRLPEQGQWFKAFIISYALTAVGFMMKGLPSIAFQGISVLLILGLHKKWKMFFHWKHLISGLFFLVPIGVYLLAFAQEHDLDSLLKRLFTESSSRTVTDKSFFESISHIFLFPFLYLIDIMPWGLGILIFLKKDARKLVWSNKFLRTCILMFVANIIIYWLSPDYRARYVFMLTPFLLIPTLYALMKEFSDKAWKITGHVITGITVLLLLDGVFKIGLPNEVEPLRYPFVIVGLGLVFLAIFWRLMLLRQMKPVFIIIASLIVLRVAYTQFMLPFRVHTGPYLNEKITGQAIADLTQGEPLAMYHSNIALTMNWYISINRGEMLTTQTDSFDFSSYYIVASEVIKDRSNVNTYFTFVRRFKQKPFEVVKFKNRFPEMPKKKD